MKQNLFTAEKIKVSKPNCSDYSLQYFYKANNTVHTSNKLEQH